jgi:hypothetical protein
MRPSLPPAIQYEIKNTANPPMKSRKSGKYDMTSFSGYFWAALFAAW